MGNAGSAAVAMSDARRAERFDVQYLATLARPDGTRTQVTVQNVSRYGFMAEGGLMFARGDAITLQISDGTCFAAHISWARDGRAGAAFIGPLASEDLIKLI